MSDPKLTTLELALLGLVDLQPQSGYDIHKLFATTPMGIFSSSPGAIYPALARLEKGGLLTSELDDSTPARPRRVYSTTTAGEAALEKWLREMVNREELVRDPRVPVLRFSLAEARLTRSEAIDYLNGFRREVSAYLDELREYTERMLAKKMIHPRLSLQHGIDGLECQLCWIESAIAELERVRQAEVADHRSPNRKEKNHG